MVDVRWNCDAIGLTAPFTTDESNPKRKPPTAPATARPITRALDAFFFDAIPSQWTGDTEGFNPLHPRRKNEKGKKK
jgi:hypothetical protein